MMAKSSSSSRKSDPSCRKNTPPFNLEYNSSGDCLDIIDYDDENMMTETIDLLTQEKWFTCYIDLLSRFQLWPEMTEVIGLSKLPNILQLNQSSTSVNLCCGNCGKPNYSHGPFECQNCKTDTSICCVCDQTVHGLYVWCQGCSHGGHLDHLMLWFLGTTSLDSDDSESAELSEPHESCPVENCGHKCQFE